MYVVTLDWKGGRAFDAIGSLGVPVSLDLPDSSGGNGKGMRPFELLLSGLAYCAMIDVLEILEKKRQPITNATMRVEASTRKDGLLSVIDEATLILNIAGPRTELVDKAVRLSLEKYCSVAGMFGHFCKVGYRIVDGA